MWATADETCEYIIGRYRQAWAHADRTFDALDLDAIGRVPWWGQGGEVTLHQIMVHMIVAVGAQVPRRDVYGVGQVIRAGRVDAARVRGAAD